MRKVLCRLKDVIATWGHAKWTSIHSVADHIRLKSRTGLTVDDLEQVNTF